MMRRARSAGIRLAVTDAPIARGMIRRGDRISDICAYFGINPGRLYDQLAEFPSGEARMDELPPPGPYVVRDILSAVRQLERCLSPNERR